MIDKSQHERLTAIKSEMEDLLQEAKDILRQAPRHVQDRAKAYWLSSIENDLDGNSMCTFQNTLDESDPGEPEDDEE